jgi:hypothetical protein
MFFSVSRTKARIGDDNMVIEVFESLVKTPEKEAGRSIRREGACRRAFKSSI